MMNLTAVVGLLLVALTASPARTANETGLQATAAEQTMLMENMAWLETGMSALPVDGPYCDGPPPNGQPPLLPECEGTWSMFCLANAKVDWDICLTALYGTACDESTICNTAWSEAYDLALDTYDADIVACRRAYIDQISVCNTISDPIIQQLCHDHNMTTFLQCKALAAANLDIAFDLADETHDDCFEAVQEDWETGKILCDTAYNNAVPVCCIED